MATRKGFFLHLLFLVLVLGIIFAASATPPMGVNYGQIANNLPSPDRVAGLLQSINVSRVKLYDSDPRVLNAFRGTGIEFVISIPNECVGKMADPANALSWVKASVQQYIPATRIRYIAIGNEVLTGNDSTLAGCLLPAMQNVYSALQSVGLQDKVQVTTTNSLAILESSYPPSSGRFRRDLSGPIHSLVDFLSHTGSPFLINAYPFFAYMADPKHVSLDYVLFRPNAGVNDPASGLHYDNMLFAQIDAVYFALEAEGHGNLPVKVSETGWPSRGDPSETAATADNAQMYNGNLLRIVCDEKGTPKRPNVGLEVYVFALFNENLKPGPSSERNYGLFKPDGTPVYDIGFGSAKLGPPSSSDHSPSPPSNSGGGGSGGSGGFNPYYPNSPPTFDSFSSATVKCAGMIGRIFAQAMTGMYLVRSWLLE